MKTFERIVGLLAIIVIILKFIHVPGAGMLTVLTLSTLSMFYFAFSFALFNNIPLKDIFKNISYKDTNVRRIIGAVGLGFALSAAIIGILFKLQLWPGANLQLITGLAWMGLILLIALIFYFRNKVDFYTGIFKRILIIGIIGIVLFSTRTATLVDIYYRNDPEYAELFKKVLADPNNPELRKQLEQLHKERLRQELKEETEKNK